MTDTTATNRNLDTLQQLSNSILESAAKAAVVEAVLDGIADAEHSGAEVDPLLKVGVRDLVRELKADLEYLFDFVETVVDAAETMDEDEDSDQGEAA